MHNRKLSQLISSLDVSPMPHLADPKILSIAYDSREVQPGALFFALKGNRFDGHQFINSAIKRNAAAVVYSDAIANLPPEIPCIRVPNTRVALSSISAEFWQHPSKSMKVIGVTGTDGKTTTVWLIHQLLEITGAATGSISTVDFSIGGQVNANDYRQSTPEAPQIHAFLRAMLDAGQDHAVLEATSHGLSSRNSRLADVDFDVAVFTNVTSEHLEFHGNLENYRRDKCRLFEMVATSRNRDAFAVINADDPHADLFITAMGTKPVFTYSLKSADVDLYATHLQPDASGTTFTLVTPDAQRDTRINLPGLHNVENLLAALCATAEIQGESPLSLVRSCPNLKGVKGRMETISGNMDFHVIVDYAHSPGSFSKIFPFFKNMTHGRLIAVFGSAGERDVEKRPEQGRIASKYGDMLFLTDEDPRGEDSMEILENIAQGVSNLRRGENLFLIPDRRNAIREAFQNAQAGDVVILLGKGHEKSIIYDMGPLDWNETAICREILQDLGYKVSNPTSAP